MPITSSLTNSVMNVYNNVNESISNAKNNISKTFTNTTKFRRFKYSCWIAI
jgi:hypothetical protein